MERSFRRRKIKMLTGARVEGLRKDAGAVQATITGPQGQEEGTAEKVLVAVGVGVIVSVKVGGWGVSDGVNVKVGVSVGTVVGVSVGVTEGLLVKVGVGVAISQAVTTMPSRL